MTLYLICEVCKYPRPISKESERFLIIASHIQCPTCKQLSAVSKELKDHVKSFWGMGMK